MSNQLMSNFPSTNYNIGIIIGTLCIVLFLIFWVTITGSKWRGIKKQLVLVVGPPNAGKTVLYHMLRDGKFIDTVSSMKEQEGTFDIHSKFTTNSIENKINILDFPGNQRVRPQVIDFYPLVKSILFIVDASDPPKFREAAEFLYDIFSNPKINDLSPSMLIACNKSDNIKALQPTQIREALENELTQLKSTRSSLETEGDYGKELQNSVPVGRDNTSFEFDIDSPCDIQFTKCSVKDGHLEDIIAFIQTK